MHLGQARPSGRDAAVPSRKMGRFSDELREHARHFFTNWADSDLPLGRKLVVFSKNRAKALTQGCCGNHGQPGC